MSDSLSASPRTSSAEAPDDLDLGKTASSADSGGSSDLGNPMPGRRWGLWMLVLGTIGLVASAALAIERYHTLIDPTYVPSCSISLFVTCGPAMGSAQGAVLGFPNAYLGIGAFPVVMTTGVMLMLGVRLPRWYWWALTAGTTAAAGLIVFLIATSVSVLGRLCPYCMVVWAVMIPLFFLTWLYGVQERYVPAPATLRRALVDNRAFVVLGGYLAVVAWVVIGLWDAVVAELQRL